MRSEIGTRILEVNQRFCRMIGYSESELIGNTLDGITHPDDVARSKRFRAALIEDDRGCAARELEKRYIRKDGAVLWAVIAASVVRNREGVPDYYVTVIQDITQRKRIEQALQDSKEQFQQLAKHIPEAFWITDLEKHAMIYISPAFERIHGIRLRSMQGARRAWKDTLHPEDRDRVVEAHRQHGARAWRHRIPYRAARRNDALGAGARISGQEFARGHLPGSRHDRRHH